MGEKKPTTLDGLMRTARQVRKEFPLNTCYNTIAAWSDRVNMMLHNQSFQTENSKNQIKCSFLVKNMVKKSVSTWLVDPVSIKSSIFFRQIVQKKASGEKL
jgi:hypothetical protein